MAAAPLANMGKALRVAFTEVGLEDATNFEVADTSVILLLYL